jgi:hypothetical protein
MRSLDTHTRRRSARSRITSGAAPVEGRHGTLIWHPADHQCDWSRRWVREFVQTGDPYLAVDSRIANIGIRLWRFDQPDIDTCVHCDGAEDGDEREVASPDRRRWQRQNRLHL